MAAIVRALVGEESKGRSGDFDRFGVEDRTTVPVDADGTVIEAMSFPAFVHEELTFETWVNSDLLGRLNRLLIVPVHRVRGAALSDVRLGQPFFWNPTRARTGRYQPGMGAIPSPDRDRASARYYRSNQRPHTSMCGQRPRTRATRIKHLVASM